MNRYMQRTQLMHQVKVLEGKLEEQMSGKNADTLLDAVKRVSRVKSKSFETLYYAQDRDGKICSYSEIPVREHEALEWVGASKTAIQNGTLYNVWHNTYIKLSAGKLKSICLPDTSNNALIDRREIKVVQPNKKVDGLVSSSEQTTKLHPERSFKGLPSDYGIATAYTEKVTNSRIRDINFELDFEQFKGLFNVTKCAISGNELGHFSRPTGMDQFSMDRVDPAKGYVMDNILIMAADLNTAKSDLDKFLLSDIPDEYKLEILNRVSHALRMRNK